ncbi:hypothetical protein H6G54_14170 [Anabaena cylindrica FACHB-243]|uniref:Uncharacterized protein n=1 Tax=Anabaena cylindrica (strain ATCC 27899 / PCC 7122) TaxID=272123 RepID=K9ZL57_ANACC|nr:MULTISPECIES: hypothetical protein [Anabaena]AFZ59514.1 hypothetical protein Anacy_4147 [Anabaena cylindrica PCC 7122]MBD2418822.1 hypothetical protein [Anabaena cylindrica FACHB-243]MBY5283328.1 hypothetical protein [Anabaena sp. CCAP 1446/1C]MBY5306804.1 hypothetical protein [Anabaena sp. CCAP 1446/1C]MCM2406387.1 hypothetical protein [Anabaena sp. CCAP 1446/1C]
MPPKITNSTTWQQAELLMQPAFIRVVDNIRKHLDVSSWKGTYHDVLIWPPNTTDETKALVTQLLQDMESATPQQVEDIRENLAHLPMPHPGYHLRLQRQEQQVNVDLWDICYQVCFLNYSVGIYDVDIDTSLIDELGEVDWQHLEEKTKQLVKHLFDSLPED